MSNTTHFNSFYNIIFDNLQLFDNKTKNIHNLPLWENSGDTQTLVVTNTLATDALANQQLQKILDACKLSKESTAIVYDVPNWSSLKQKLTSIENILLFGVTENDLGITGNWQPNKIISFDDISWIKTASVTTLQNDNNLKADLWNNALKALFIK